VSGVSAFYRAVERHIANAAEIVPVEIGSLTSSSFHLIRDQLIFREALGNSDVDIVHLNPSLKMRSFLRDGLFFLWAKQKGLPILVHVHGWEHRTAERIEGGPLGWFFRRTLGRGDAYVVLAEEFREKLVSLGIDAPIHLGTTAVENGLLNGFDIDTKLREYSPDVAIRILFLARIEKEKGIYETIEACSRLIGEGLPIHLTVAGNGSELENARKIAGDKLGGAVTFLGFVLGDQKMEAFRKSDLYVLPTYGEGMPASVLEAMALGLPVITRPVGGLRDFFIDGEHGYLMESMDASTLASLIRKLAGDEGLWRKMSAASHSYAVGRFLGSRVAERLVELYGTITR